MFYTEVLGFLFSSFISLYSLNKLFTKINSSWQIYESIKDLEIKTCIELNLVFANKTILLCFFFVLIIDSYFLIPRVVAQIFNPNAEHVIPIGTPVNKANAEIETQPTRAETKRRRCSK